MGVKVQGRRGVSSESILCTFGLTVDAAGASFISFSHPGTTNSQPRYLTED